MDCHKLPHHLVLPVAKQLIAKIRQQDVVINAWMAGSVRRWSSMVDDVDIVSCICPSGITAFKQWFNRQGKPQTGEAGKDKISINMMLNRINLRVNLTMCSQLAAGATLAYTTGPMEHTHSLRRMLSNKGFFLNRVGIWENGDRRGGEDERHIYHLAGVPWHPPEIRDAHVLSKIPRLLKKEDIDILFSPPTTWSGGLVSEDTIIKNAIAARKKAVIFSDRVEYLGKNYPHYISSIRALKHRYAPWISIGVAVRTSIENESVRDQEGLDFIIADVKNNKNRVSRLIRAIKSDVRIRMISNPTGRILSSNPDPPKGPWQLLFKEAHKRGVVLEISSDPRRMDLPSSLVRQAKEEGCKFCITAHKGSITYGTKIARRAMLTKRDIICPQKWLKW